ncbi:MAG TPA: TonB-dependent receptor [Edaphobacter sp.]|nr:TonB-dependent receptor [Edaphobacter sp.]
MRARFALYSFFALLLACSVAFGQTITGSLTGTVSDPSGAAVIGATVTAMSVDTGVQTPTTTNAAGVYTLRFLQPGHYKLSITSSGFSSTTAGPFTLEVGQEAKIDAKLNLGSVSENVIVTAAAPILNAENPTTGDTITGAQATELPLQARNFSSLTNLVAGAISVNPMAQNSVARAGYNGGFNINGNREQSNNYTLDGADINEAIDNYIGYSPNVDALGEIHIISGNATAEYGNANGGQVVMTTKSGTNQFHGNAFWFIENTNLNANTWANKNKPNPADIGPVPTLNRGIFGGTFGGPLIHDRLFFFVDYQGARQHGSTTEPRSVPTDAMRAGFAPKLGHAVPITNPVAQFLLAHPELYPRANVATSNANGITGNYSGVYGTATHNDQGDIKIDSKLTSRDNLSGRFTIGRENDGYTKVSLPTDIPSNNSNPYTGFVANWTHVFSPSIINEARAGYGRTRYRTTPEDLGGKFGVTGNSQLGIPGTQIVPGISTFDLTSTVSALDPIGTTAQNQGNGAYAGIDTDSIVNAFTYGDNLSWQLHRHTLKFGAQALRYQQNRYYSGNDGALGWFQYKGTATSGSTGISDPWSDFLQNDAFSFGQGAVTGRWGQRQWRDALFVQDDYKMTPDLTINLGMRWEWDQPMYEINNKQVNIDLATGAIQDAGQNGNSRALYSSFWGGFMPRVGFAYSPNHFNGKFVVRGGYGITNFLEGTGANLRLTLNPPFFVDSSQQSNGTTFFQTQNGFPRPADATELAGNVRAWDPKLKPALIQQFNLTTETQLDNSTSLVIAYLGQTGSHLVDPREANQKMCPKCPFPIASFPALSAVSNISFTESKAMMNYNALQTTVRRRVTNGLEFLANYTWSHSLTNNLGYYGAGGGAAASQSAYWQDSYNGGADYGPAYFDVTHNFSFSGYYDLPFGRGRQFGSGMNRFADLAVGGWKLGAVASLHSGLPITMFSSQNPNWAVNQRTDRANHYRKLRIVNRSVNNWFGTDPSATPCAADVDNGVCAYGEESSTGLGTAAVGSERAPNYHDLDAALSKAFNITESKHLDFRADFFNVLNTTSFAPANNNVSGGIVSLPVDQRNFGQLSSSSPTVSTERQIQLALKLVF